jgi:hypothetical protein
MRSTSTAATSVSSNDGWQLKTLQRTPSNNFKVELEKRTLMQETKTIDQRKLREMVTASTTDNGWKLMAFERTPSDNMLVKVERTAIVHKYAKLNQQRLGRLLAGERRREGKVTKSAEKPIKKR